MIDLFSRLQHQPEGIEAVDPASNLPRRNPHPLSPSLRGKVH